MVKIKRSLPTKRKKYTKAKEGYYNFELNDEKRHSVPDFDIRVTNLDYLSIASGREGVSRSRYLEQMIKKVLFFTTLKEPIFYIEQTEKPRQRKRNSSTYAYKKTPKFSMHPSIMEILRRIKKERGISFSVLFDEIFLIYRGFFPIYLNI